MSVTLADNQTKFFQAVSSGRKDDIQALIRKGDIDVNFVYENGQTALFHAARNGHYNVIKTLVDAGADVNKTDLKDKTALFDAAQRGKEDVILALIKAGANVNKVAKGDDDKTALFYAKSKGVVSVLVRVGEAEVNKRDVNGRTPIFYANSRSLISSLVTNGANLMTKDNYDKSCFSFLIEINVFSGNQTEDLSGLYNLLNGHGLTTRRKLFKEIVSLVFCKSLLAISDSQTSIRSDIANLLKKAKYYTNETREKNVVRNISQVMQRLSSCEVFVSEVLTPLIQLKPLPNSVDSKGNTALHYADHLLFCNTITDMTMIDILSTLKEHGVNFNRKNIDKEIPLLRLFHELSLKNTIEVSTIQLFFTVCGFFERQRFPLNETSRQGDSVFHLIFKIFQRVLLQYGMQRDILIGFIELMNKFSHELSNSQERTIINPDVNFNSPVHLWASLELRSAQDYNQNLSEDQDLTFENLLKQMLEQLVDKCNVPVNGRNRNEETPIHVCKTWSAVKLLIDHGANPKDQDSVRRSPLLAAAKNKTFDRENRFFYRDVLLEPEEFWRTAHEKGLDLWTVDRNGESLFSVLIESEAFDLANGLLHVTSEANFVNQSDEIAVSFLNDICRDKSTRTHWKSILVKNILDGFDIFLNAENRDLPLHCCCRNIVETSRGLSDDKLRTTVHWEIAEQLLLHGASCDIPDTTGQTCLDIAETCRALYDLLTQPIDNDEVPPSIPWKSVSNVHKPKLAKVARRQESTHIERFWYHNDCLQRGSFSIVYVGINERDGREVAIKRTEKERRPSEVDREISHLLGLESSEQVVKYLEYFEDRHFFYIVLELMEGNLEDCLTEISLDENTKTEMCKDIVLGLKYLHSQSILHLDLKPTNILYTTHPKLRLKIADFNKSHHVDSDVSTITGTRSWSGIAPEQYRSLGIKSELSDIFSCGLIMHYILSKQNVHPYKPANVDERGQELINKTETNVMNGNMEGWDDSLNPEATHLVRKMLESNSKERPTAEVALTHPFFWSNRKKINFLIAVGNQPEFECPRGRRTPPLTQVETDLDVGRGFNPKVDIKRAGTWNSIMYIQVNAIYNEMTRMRRGRNLYDTRSVVELVRFIRNAYSHVSEPTRPTLIRKQLLNDFVFLKCFPNLLMEVYKTVTTHGWDQREEIKNGLLE